MPLLSMYLCLWSCHALASGEASVSGGGRYPASAAWLQHDLVHYALAILVLFAAWRPSLRTLCASHLAVCALRLARVPHLFDGEYWALSTDFTLMLFSAHSLLRRPRCQPGAAHDQNDVFRAAASTASAQLICCYYGAFFWKLNPSWHDPTRSCASVLLTQVVSGWLPERFVPLWLPAVLVRIAPFLSTAMELTIPSLLMLSHHKLRRCGIALGLLFHLLIALIPVGEANNAAGFSVLCAVRYAFLMPDATSMSLAEGQEMAAQLMASLKPKANTFQGAKASAALELRGGPLFWSAGLLAVIAATASIHRSQFFDLYTSRPVYVALMTVLLRALAWEAKLDTAKRTSPAPIGVPTVEHKASRVLVGCTAFQIFLMPILGLSDVGASHMYSNMRLFGGSNHYLVPTGLLHALGERVPAWMGSESAFAGGVVLVEATDSTWINGIYPGEVTNLSPRTVAWLRSGGHAGRAFSSIDGRVLLREPSRPSKSAPFVPYKCAAALQARHRSIPSPCCCRPYLLLW